MGHYAGALLPRARGARVPFLLLLLLANFGDFLWLVLAPLGIEKTTPSSFLDVSFQNMHVDMIWSHNLLVALPIAAVIGAAVLAWKRHAETALWCGALVIAHVVEDWLVGFDHELGFHGSPHVGLDLYERAPAVAIFVEAAFAAACVLAYVTLRRRAGRGPSTRMQVALYGVFAGGALAFLPTASRSLSAWLGP